MTQYHSLILGSSADASAPTSPKAQPEPFLLQAEASCRSSSPGYIISKRGGGCQAKKIGLRPMRLISPGLKAGALRRILVIGKARKSEGEILFKSLHILSLLFPFSSTIGPGR